MLPGLPGLPSLPRAAQLLPSLVDEGCAPSLTLYLPWGQVAFAGGLVGTRAALDPHAHVGPPDLDRHVVDEWRDSLVSIHPMGQDREGVRPTSPTCFPEDQGGRIHSPVGNIFPVQLIVAVVIQVVVTAAAAETNGEKVTVLGQSSYPDRNLTWGNRCELFLRSQDSPLRSP